MSNLKHNLAKITAGNRSESQIISITLDNARIYLYYCKNSLKSTRPGALQMRADGGAREALRSACGRRVRKWPRTRAPGQRSRRRPAGGRTARTREGSRAAAAPARAHQPHADSELEPNFEEEERLFLFLRL